MAKITTLGDYWQWIAVIAMMPLGLGLTCTYLGALGNAKLLDLGVYLFMSSFLILTGTIALKAKEFNQLMEQKQDEQE